MKNLLPLLILIFAFSAFGQETLNNNSVIEMVKSGLSETVIIAKIRNSEVKFDTSTEELKKLAAAGVPERIVEAMIEAGAKPNAVSSVKPDAQIEAARTALKALRRLNSATDVGIAYVNYSPLVAEVKTEVEDSLPRINNQNLKQEIAASMLQYEFAAAVWQAYWRSDFIEGEAREIAVKQYGVQKRGLLKVVWRNDFIAAIWARAKLHFGSAERIYTQLSNNDNFSGVWKILIENGGETIEVYISVNRYGEDYIASLRTPFGNSIGLPVDKKEGNFSITYSVQDKTLTLLIESKIADKKLKGMAIYNDGKETKSLSFAGSMIVIN